MREPTFQELGALQAKLSIVKSWMWKSFAFYALAVWSTFLWNKGMILAIIATFASLACGLYCHIKTVMAYIDFQQFKKRLK